MHRRTFFHVVHRLALMPVFLLELAIGLASDPGPTPTPVPTCGPRPPAPAGLTEWRVGGAFTVDASLGIPFSNEVPGYCDQPANPSSVSLGILNGRFDIIASDSDYWYSLTHSWVGYPSCTWVPDTSNSQMVPFNPADYFDVAILSNPDYTKKLPQEIEFQVDDRSDLYYTTGMGTGYDDGTATDSVTVIPQPPCWPDSFYVATVISSGQVEAGKFGHYVRICGTPPTMIQNCWLMELVTLEANSCGPTQINQTPIGIEVTGGTDGPGPNCFGDNLAIDYQTVDCSLLPCSRRVKQEYRISCTQNGTYRVVHTNYMQADIDCDPNATGNIQICIRWGVAADGSGGQQVANCVSAPRNCANCP